MRSVATFYFIYNVYFISSNYFVMVLTNANDFISVSCQGNISHFHLVLR